MTHVSYQFLLIFCIIGNPTNLDSVVLWYSRLGGALMLLVSIPFSRLYFYGHLVILNCYMFVDDSPPYH